MNTLNTVAISMTVLAVCVGVRAEPSERDETTIQVRGQPQIIHIYRASHALAKDPKVLFAPGDAGCRGFAISIAQELAKAGHDTYCFDTLRYLQSFTGPHVLTTSDIAPDFRAIALSITQQRSAPVLLVGWSEGAGLGLVAATDPTNHEIFMGVIAIGTPEINILAWRWKDAGAWITRRVPHEPTFRSADFVRAVSPLPLFFIASSSNEYVSPEATRVLFSEASKPKQLVIVNARDHKYGGNREGFFSVLRQALDWIETNQAGRDSH